MASKNNKSKTNNRNTNNKNNNKTNSNKNKANNNNRNNKNTKNNNNKNNKNNKEKTRIREKKPVNNITIFSQIFVTAVCIFMIIYDYLTPRDDTVLWIVLLITNVVYLLYNYNKMTKAQKSKK